MSDLTIGLVGTGSMASVYADRIGSMPAATVTAIASPNTAEEFAAEHVPGAETYAAATDLYDDADVDAVAVLTPTHTHRELVEEAVDRGLDVICEKPLARTIEDAEAIVDTVEGSDVTFMTAHVVRFFPEYETAKRRVDDGAIGTPGIARARRAFGFSGPRDGWAVDRAKSGGALLDLGIHDIDFLRWTLGPVERVFTRTAEWGEHGESEVTLTTLRFTDGAVGHVEASWVEVPSVPFDTAFEFAGDEGLIEFDSEDVRSVVVYDDGGVHVPRDPAGHDLPLARDGYYRQLEHFFECVRTGAEPDVTAADGADSVRVGLAALESADRGVPVAPAELEAGE